MANKVCFIVGHGKSKTGGYDSGAVSKDGKYHEFKIAREITRYAQEYYNATYEEQADIMNYNGDLYLADRIKLANEMGYEVIEETHLNSSTSETAKGTECYYENKDSEGQTYADAICDQIAMDLGVEQRKYGTDADGGDKVKLNSDGSDYFGIIRQPNKVGVRLLVETVFISNASDLAKVSTVAGQKKCGEAIAKAIAKRRGAKKKAPTTTTATSTIKKGDLVSIKSGATYYNGKSIPNWVMKTKWYVKFDVVGDRAVINKSEDGKYSINSPINVAYLTLAKATTVATQKNNYFKKYTEKSASLVDALKAIGAANSFSYRKKIAKANGVTLYVGTSAQNIKLLGLLKQGKLIKP